MFFEIMCCHIIPNHTFLNDIIIKPSGSDPLTYLNLRLRSLVLILNFRYNTLGVSILLRHILKVLKPSIVFQLYYIDCRCPSFIYDCWLPCGLLLLLNLGYIKDGKFLIEDFRVMKRTSTFPLRIYNNVWRLLIRVN
jgi:hypothetical protein